MRDQPSEISTGFEFEARFRYLNNPTFPQKGGVGAFWTYWNHGTSGDVENEFYSSYEIDYEMFHNETYVLGTSTSRYVQMQNYRNFNTSKRGLQPYPDPYSDLRITKRAPRLSSNDTPDWNQWNTVKIKWTPKGDGSWRTEWFIQTPTGEKSLGMEDTMAPDKWMTVRFNIWNFRNSGNSPVSDPALNRSYFLDVDWVKVSKVAPVTIAASVTEVGGVAVSSGATTTVPNLSVVKGQVAATAGAVGMINVVIRRLSDNTKWKGYADGNGPAGWVPASQNVGTGTNNAQPTWTTNGVMPSGSNVTAGDYQISADVLSGGTYVSSPLVTVRINNNRTPVSVSFGPTGGSTNVGTARVATASYTDEDGTDDIKICAVEVRQGNVATTAFYDKATNLLSLSGGNGSFAPGSANVISNSFISLNCADTPVFVNPGANKVQINWNFTPKQPLAGNNIVNLDVTDKAGAHAGFVQKATWTIVGAPMGNSAPVAVEFAPFNSGSAVGNPYGTQAVYSDADGPQDLKFLIVAIVQGSQQTRAYYDVPTNKLYLHNDAGQYVGGVTPGTNAVISNSLVTLDCSLTTIFVATDARKQIRVNWRFIARSGLVGVNDIHIVAFDTANASSGFPKKATWTVYAPSAMKSAGGSAAASKAPDQDSQETTKTAENPDLGQIGGGDTSKGLPKKNVSDGSQGPPDMEIPPSNAASSVEAQQPNPSTQSS